MPNEPAVSPGSQPKLVSVVTPCYNEADNVRELRDAIREQFAAMPGYRYEHIFIDNASTDGTAAILRELAAGDSKVKVILNTRNFGHIRSPHHAILQAKGDVVIVMASDFQDPPGLIPDFLCKWEQGYKIVLGVKAGTEEAPLMSAVRRAYYRLLAKLSEIRITEDATGFGLYDRDVVEALRKIDDPYPYARGLLADIGYETATIPFHKPNRRRGITKNNFYTLYDMAMLGITNHSRVPLRLATMLGFVMSGLSFLLALVYLIMKLVFWYRYTAGMAPVLIGVLLFSSIQLFFIGILGEYIGTILTQVQKRPLVIEKERINFEGEGTVARGSQPASDPRDLTPHNRAA
jgi:glycosyltransferase involved in cell wall biosynthesis